jgi:hypothetical protein
MTAVAQATQADPINAKFYPRKGNNQQKEVATSGISRDYLQTIYTIRVNRQNMQKLVTQ